MTRLRQAAALFIALLFVAPVAPAEAACETATEPIGPPVPQGRDPGGVAVALIDSGIAYDLPEVSKRLARDKAGCLLGYDFQDNDRRPQDLVPGSRPERPRRHGTAVASIIVLEAPKARLAPFRYRTRDFAVFADVVAAIAKGPARIVNMPLGGYRAEDWRNFEAAARAHPELLFIISAGNDGRNIDEAPIYPAGFGLPNALVVTSTDDFGRYPAESNWGPQTVDLSVPGENRQVFDHRGVTGRASGTSYAVPRVTALAARLSAAHPDWSAAKLKSEILALAGPNPATRTKRTRHGWIANPALIAADR